MEEQKEKSIDNIMGRGIMKTKGEKPMELFEQITSIVDVQNKAIMSGIELGRKESKARIKGLENDNVKLLEALKGSVDMQFFTHEDAEIMRDIAVEAIKQAEE